MKAKTSVTLSKEILRDIDRMAGPRQSRSAFIERVLHEHLRSLERAQTEARELELLNRAADELVPELEDVLRYQANPDELLK
jgi:metal-responsive CopG/Arc/MetJ family transcriptional regulator